MKIIATSPCRISLIGGGTDVDPFASQYGGKVLNLAISLYHQAILTPHLNKNINISALGSQLNLDSYSTKLSYGNDPKFDLIRAIINYFQPRLKSGFSLVITGPDHVLGLGRSGSVAVAVISALNYWLKTKLSLKAIGLLAADLEIIELGWSGGRQDSLAAVFGGINIMDFGPGKKISVQPVKLHSEQIKSFLDWTFMIHIGGDHHSYRQQEKLIQGMSNQQKLSALKSLKAAVPLAVKALKASDWQALGTILHQGWLAKKKSNPIVANKFIDQVYQQSINCGALGGKVAGSGGAGNMFFIIPPEKKPLAIKSLTALGAELVPFTIDFQGVKVEKYAD